MSYSVNSPCLGCKKSDTCSDGEIIQGAVNTIHQIGYSKGHQGAGSVTHTCQNYEPKEE